MDSATIIAGNTNTTKATHKTKKQQPVNDNVESDFGATKQKRKTPKKNKSKSKIDKEPASSLSKTDNVTSTKKPASPSSKTTRKKSLSVPSRRKDTAPDEKLDSANRPISFVPTDSLDLKPKTIMTPQIKTRPSASTRPIAPSDSAQIRSDASTTERSVSSRSSSQAPSFETPTSRYKADNNSNRRTRSSSIDTQSPVGTYEIGERTIQDQIALAKEMAEALSALPEAPKTPSQRKRSSWVTSERSKAASPTSVHSKRELTRSPSLRSTGLSDSSHSARSSFTIPTHPDSVSARRQRRGRRSVQSPSALARTLSSPSLISPSTRLRSVSRHEYPEANSTSPGRAADRPLLRRTRSQRSERRQENEQAQSQSTRSPGLRRVYSHDKLAEAAATGNPSSHSPTVRTPRRSRSFTMDRSSSRSDLRRRSRSHTLEPETDEPPRRSGSFTMRQSPSQSNRSRSRSGSQSRNGRSLRSGSASSSDNELPGDYTRTGSNDDNIAPDTIGRSSHHTNSSTSVSVSSVDMEFESRLHRSTGSSGLVHE